MRTRTRVGNINKNKTNDNNESRHKNTNKTKTNNDNDDNNNNNNNDNVNFEGRGETYDDDHGDQMAGVVEGGDTHSQEYLQATPHRSRRLDMEVTPCQTTVKQIRQLSADSVAS